MTYNSVSLYSSLGRYCSNFKDVPTDEDIRQTVNVFRQIRTEQAENPRFVHYGRRRTGLKHFKFSACGPYKIFLRGTKDNCLLNSGSQKLAYRGLNCITSEEVAILKCPSERLVPGSIRFDYLQVKRMLDEAKYTDLFKQSSVIISNKMHGIYKGRHNSRGYYERFEIVAEKADMDLYVWLTSYYRPSEKPPLSLTLPLMKQMAQAVLDVHSRDLVHRDVKIENYLITSGSDGQSIKLTDFGMCSGDNEDDLARLRGTFAYLPPDAVCRYQSRAILYKTLYQAQKGDIYALGICFYMMLYRRGHFFQEELEPQIRQGVCRSAGILGSAWLYANMSVKHYKWGLAIRRHPPGAEQQLLTLISEMLRPQYERRPNLEHVIQNLEKIMKRLPVDPLF